MLPQSLISEDCGKTHQRRSKPPTAFDPSSSASARCSPTAWPRTAPTTSSGSPSNECGSTAPVRDRGIAGSASEILTGAPLLLLCLTFAGSAALRSYIRSIDASPRWSPVLRRLDTLLTAERALSSQSRFGEGSAVMLAGIKSAALATTQVHELLHRHAMLDPTIDPIGSAPRCRSVTHRLAALQEERSAAVTAALQDPERSSDELPLLRSDAFTTTRDGRSISLHADLRQLRLPEGPRALGVPARYDRIGCPAITATGRGAHPEADETPVAQRSHADPVGAPTRTPLARRATPGMIDRLYDVGTAIAPLTLHDLALDAPDERPSRARAHRPRSLGPTGLG